LITVGVKHSGHTWIEAAVYLSSEMDISNWRKEVTKILKNFCSKVFCNASDIMITTCGILLEKLRTQHCTERSHSYWR